MAGSGGCFEADGFHTSDGDTGIYFRPESGNNILIGSEDPDCDPKVWVGRSQTGPPTPQGSASHR